MYSGQFEMRTLPVAGEPSSGAADDVPAEPPSPPVPHAASTAGPSANAAAAAAPPPRKRRREVRFAVSRASRRGSIFSGMGGLSVNSDAFGHGQGRRVESAYVSSSLSSRSS